MDIFNFILHIDQYLLDTVQQYGTLSYIILFLIIFVETGLVIVPFLPGDSLLFIAGTLAAGKYLDLKILLPLLTAAAIIGDSVNYYVGSRLGAKVFKNENARFFKPAYLAKTQEFYDKHGGKTIILARFIPIVRTFAPFLAGVGNMKYGLFLAYNVIGAIIWVVGLTLAGYFFGNIPIIKDNFEFFIIGIIAVSFMPAIAETIRHSRSPKKDAAKTTSYEELKKTFQKDNLND